MSKNSLLFLIAGAILYFVVAQLGKALFSFEPYNISLLWLPFGIGVILVEKFGYKAAFSIFVASFLSHFNIHYDDTFHEIIHRAIPALADSIAPLFSVYLIKKYVGNDFKDISILLPLTILGGIIPTTFSGTIISLNLVASGYISLSEVLEFAIFLIYSDILGLMLLYPLFKNYDNTSITKKEKSVILTTFILSFVVIILSVKYLYLIFLLYPIVLVATFKIRIKYLMMILLFVVIFSIFMFKIYKSYTIIDISSLDFILAQSSFLATFIFIILGVSLHNSELEDKKQKIIKTKKQIKKNENALRQHTKLAAMGELVGLIAHQWRQPLATSNIIVSTLQAKNQANQINKDYLTQKLQGIEQTNLYMSETIENFLQYFSPNKEKELFSALDATNKTLNVINSLIDKNNIKLMLDFKDDGKILGFKNEYSQVILTLITNCVQAFSTQTKKLINIQSFIKDDYFYLSVYDNAGGINPKDLPKIFEPYFSTKDSMKGSGLGLYIAKMIIENHMKGTIKAQNLKDGAKFTIKTKMEKENGK